MFKLVMGLCSVAAGMYFAYDGGRLLRESYDEYEEEKRRDRDRLSSIEANLFAMRHDSQREPVEKESDKESEEP